MEFDLWLTKANTGFRFKSIGLQLASPVDIRNWAFYRDPKGKPLTGEVINSGTIAYKTLKPEKGGLFCTEVFGPDTGKKDRRYKPGYINFFFPLAHIWYLKGSPSYLSIILKGKRQMIQRVLYADMCISLPLQVFQWDIPYPDEQKYRYFKAVPLMRNHMYYASLYNLNPTHFYYSFFQEPITQYLPSRFFQERKLFYIRTLFESQLPRLISKNVVPQTSRYRLVKLKPDQSEREQNRKRYIDVEKQMNAFFVSNSDWATFFAKPWFFSPLKEKQVFNSNDFPLVLWNHQSDLKTYFQSNSDKKSTQWPIHHHQPCKSSILQFSTIYQFFKINRIAQKDFIMPLNYIYNSRLGYHDFLELPTSTQKHFSKNHVSNFKTETKQNKLDLLPPSIEKKRKLKHRKYINLVLKHHHDEQKKGLNRWKQLFQINRKPTLMPFQSQMPLKSYYNLYQTTNKNLKTQSYYYLAYVYKEFLKRWYLLPKKVTDVLPMHKKVQKVVNFFLQPLRKKILILMRLFHKKVIKQSKQNTRRKFLLWAECRNPDTRYGVKFSRRLGLKWNYPYIAGRFTFIIRHLRKASILVFNTIRKSFLSAGFSFYWPILKKRFLSKSKTLYFFIQQVKPLKTSFKIPTSTLTSNQIPLKQPLVEKKFNDKKAVYRCFSVLSFQYKFSIRLTPILKKRFNPTFLFDSFRMARLDDLVERQLNKRYIRSITFQRFNNVRQNIYQHFDKRNSFYLKDQIVCLFPKVACAFFREFKMERSVERLVDKVDKSTPFLVKEAIVPMVKEYYDNLMVYMETASSQLKEWYPLPNLMEGDKPEFHEDFAITHRPIFAKTFTITYIPLSCRYALAPKNLHLIELPLPKFEDLPTAEVLFNSPNVHAEDWPITPTSFKKPIQKGFRNPLGHRNFRKALQSTFQFSIKKSVLISQLKTATQHICSQKAKTLSFGLSIQNQKVKIFSRRFKTLLTFEKQKLIYSFLHYFCNGQEQLEKRPWKKHLMNAKYAVLPLKPNVSFICFQQRHFYKTLWDNLIFKMSSQKSSDYYEPFRTQLYFPYRLFKDFYKQILSVQKNGLVVKKLFSLPFDQLKNPAVCLKSRWQPEKPLFTFLQRKKRFLNEATSKICHNIDFFTGLVKSDLLTHPKWLNLKLGIDHPKKRKSRFFNTHPFQLTGKHLRKLEVYKSADTKNLKRLLKRLHVPFVKKGFKMKQQIKNYISIKTKLCKAKVVRFLLTSFLLGSQTVDQPSLNVLLWFFNCSKQSIWRLNNYDFLLYRRCLAYHKPSRIKTFKTSFIKRFITFLLRTKPVNSNSYAVVNKLFAWEIDDDLEDLTFYMHWFPNVEPFNRMNPVHMEHFFVHEKPMLGGWPIRTLLKKFKSQPTASSYLFNKVAKVKNHVLMDHYSRFLSVQLDSLRYRLYIYKKWYRLVHIRSFPQAILKRFASNNPIQSSKKRLRVVRKYRFLIEKLTVRQTNLTRRYKIMRPFFTTNNDPAWLMLNCLPVLPPDLRPALLLESGQFAVSDLTILYQQLIQRVKSLNEPLELTTINNPMFFKRSFLGFDRLLRLRLMLAQKACDAVLDNGKSDSKPVLNTRGQPLKSLAEMLRGKKGRFRQNLLGKRVDYSGRSVIVVGPQLKVHQCGLPKEMALELFQTFLIRFLIQNHYHPTITKARKWIRLKKPTLWLFLEKVIYNRPILLNRAPTLHRLGIQAFQPTLVDGRTILLHPLVCSAFNADFDGDQMAVHVPLSYDACSEAWRLMWSRYQLFSPATGDPILMPTQDMVLGCAYLSTWDNVKHKNAITTRFEKVKFQSMYLHYWFTSIDEVLHLFYLKKVSIHQVIWLKWSHPFECQQHQSCCEFQLDKKGRCFEYYPDFHIVATKQFEKHIWIKTTAGRALMNQVFFQAMEIG